MDRDRREPEKTSTRSRHGRHKFSKLLPCGFEEIYCRKALLLAAMSFIIALLIIPSFKMDAPTYRLGDIAHQNIKAQRDFLIQDEEATAKKREEAMRQSVLVYDLDDNLTRITTERVENAFASMRRYLAGLEYQPSDGVSKDQIIGAPVASENLSTLVLSNAGQHILRKKKDFENAFGSEVSGEIFTTLLERQFTSEIEQKIVHLVKNTLTHGIVSTKAWLRQNRGDSLLIRKIGGGEEFMVPRPFPYPDLEEARKLIVMQALEPGRDVKEMMVIAALVSQLIQPNLTFNHEETDRRREEAYNAIKPVFIKIARNEMLVREGQRIGPEELLKLKFHLTAGTGRHWALIFVAVFMFSAVCISVVVHVTKHHLPAVSMNMSDLLFLSLLLAFMLILSRAGLWTGDLIGDSNGLLSTKTFIYAVPLSAGAMMACIFFGVTVSLIFSLVFTLFAGMIFGKDFGLFFYFMIGSFVAAHGVTPCRNRMVPIKAGLLVGLVNVTLIVLSALLQDQWVLLKVLANAFFGLSGGIFAGILVTGLTPLAEMFFGYTTDIKLLELATMDQPLLQSLMVEAPGTYHHSIIVGNMVEAAAKSIGANPLLAKVAAYYHDIGKIKKPLYFIENQLECENRHEKLAPSMSSLILIAHVKDGVELAKQHHLGCEIIDIISQHHGKSFISFFYNKAVEAREKSHSPKASELPPVNMDDYRYPGPKPQTKEAGLVMLADVVEAACRSLTEPTPARIQGQVNRLINNIFIDGQLDECELTLKDLHQIAKHFNQILATIHHKRIEYPVTNGKGKPDAPDSAQREPKQDKDKQGTSRDRCKTDLKRLGIH
ncbi:MAG: HDIG domain-containing metalloprotein [Syntrophobacteraceae bacterium]